MEGGVTPYSSSMAPSGSYILIIVSQPVNDDHKKTILERLNKGLLSWDVESTGCDLSGLEAVCSNIDAKHLHDTDVLIQHSTESLGVEVLVSPTVSTFKQCVKNLFSTSTGHKHLIHAGYTFAGTGSWILSNGTFSFDEFLEIFQQADVQNQKRCNINVHCAEAGSWNGASFAKDIFTKVANVSFNPPEKVSIVPGSEHLIGCLERVLSSQALEEIMAASNLVGNIRFNRPTLYLFPAGQGDCALFGINGFNMLIDGGFNRKPCSWEFIRHLDRLDAVLVTRLCENNVLGMSTLMKRKCLNNTYPQIGYVFCNIAETNPPSPKEELIKNKNDLIVSVVGEGHNFTQTLNELKLKPHQCWRDSSVEPFVLYHKVGHGTLEMHVLSPPKDSKEMKEFLTEWSSYKETFSCVKSGLKSKSLESAIPLSHATSICAVLIWRPADPKDTITRILFPGSAPQSKIFESLEKLKNLDVLKQPVVTKASLSVIVTKTVNNVVEKSISRTSIPNRKNTASPALSVSSVASRNGDIPGVKKEIKKVVKDVKKDNKDAKKEIKKEVKKDPIVKEVKKTASVPKKDVTVKKEGISKEPKKDNKDVKQVVKKDSKDLKAVIDKKSEMKSTSKKIESASPISKTVSEVKKTSTTTVRKSTTAVKKEVSKSASALKSAEVKKTAPSKVSEPKAAKDVSNKKAAEAKAAKTKPKTANSTPKSTPKTTPKATSVASKPGTKVTKAVAASSIVASVVAVTAAAFELNEKKEEIVDTEPEIVPDKEPEITDLKDVGIAEKSEEVNVSPLPPEALSPTPSESISLTPSDTLSSAPLETVSPTPPLANEPMSMEEKEVNEIKDIEQDPIPYETEATDEVAAETVEVQQVEEQDEEVNEIELELAKRQENADVMSMSFIGSKDLESPEIEEVISKTEASADVFSTQNIKNVDSEELDETNQQINDNEYQEGGDNKGLEFVDYSKEVENIDNQLAHLSMEGSFCAGRTSYEQEQNNDFVAVENSNKISEIEQSMNDFSDQGISSVSTEKEVEVKDYEQEIEQQHQLGMTQSFMGTDQVDIPENVENITESHSEIIENVDQFSHSDQNSEIAAENNYQDNQFSSQDLDNKYVSDTQEKEVTDEKYHEEGRFSPEPLIKQHEDYQEYVDHHDVKSIEQSINDRVATDDYDISRNIIEDAEMQETSVDEPEEIVRKESAVSITLNDDSLGVDYDDDMRRKSYTESEDDVDIQNYMSNDRKDSFEQDKLNARCDADSDNEDVVKSPTPHAIVDYEGHVDDVRESGVLVEENSGIDQDQNAAYLTEKQDFDEKDHDSAEEQENTDDGEMIRHPTPEMKYSEDEMRDPIGQHYITAPGLKVQVSGITEQPLYEEPEDAGSERSVSPLVEQPVFGNVEADFPELVTVSGGTTPSEPHSPKTGLDARKFVSEAAVMDALSEHDCSESSTHSPLCYDENTTFELPVSEENFQKDNVHALSADQDEITHEIDSKNVHEYEQESNDLHASEQESKDLHASEQESKDLHTYEQESKDLNAYEEESKDLHEYEQESKYLHSYGQESEDLYAYEQKNKELQESVQESKDLHEYEQDHKDLHGGEQEITDLHGDKQEIADLYKGEQEITDLHRGEQEFTDLHKGEQEITDSHGGEQEITDLHRDEQENTDLHGDELDCKDLRRDELDGKDVCGYELDSKDLREDENDSKDPLEDNNEPLQKEMISITQQGFLNDNQSPINDKLDNIHSSNYDAPSDEESYSQNDKSETRSEKSDGDEEKSDIHRDDRSDHQHDGKSDVMDDDQIERKSDLHEDDRSDSHFDDRQDGYDGKGENSFDVPEDTRSHNYGSEQFNVDDANKYEMQYERYEILEKFQHNETVGDDDAIPNYEASETQNKSFENDRITPEGNKESTIQTNIIDGNSETKLDDLQCHEEFVEVDNNVQIGTEHIPAEHKASIMKNDDIPENFNIPSGLHEDKAYDSDEYSSNIPPSDRFDESNISSQIPEHADKINVDHSISSENFESSYDQYEEIRTNETHSEISKEILTSQASYYSNYENEELGVMKQGLISESRFPDELNLEGSNFQESGEHIIDTQSTGQDDSPQFSGLENKILTKMTEAHQYEALSKFEENAHTSNIAYSESSSITNIVSDSTEQQVEFSETNDFEDKNFNLISEETKYSTSENNLEYLANERDFHGEISETYSQMSSSIHGAINEEHDEKPFGYSSGLNFSSVNHGFDMANSDNINLENASRITHEEIQETNTDVTSGNVKEYHHEFNSEQVPHDEASSNLILDSASESTRGLLNGKDQTSWSHSVSGYTAQYETETNSSVTQEHTSYTTNSEQENSYIINSRFHSDSPEDNIMRSDSSPDVPPYPLDAAGQLADLQSSMPDETQSFPTKDDYPNINLPKVSGAPLSPNKTRNTNRDSPYGESSEDEEDSSSIPGTVSPYAYTNKAYAKEEEDVDGNHIYKESMSIESTTGIMKEFDGNNPQTMTAQQVGYSHGYQETEYTGETNYDFRLEEWGKPMGLPTPPDSTHKTVAKKPEKKSLGKSAGDTNGKTYSPSVSKMSSPLKKPKAAKESSSSAVYVDLAYVPHHGDPQYCDVEFFKKVRARYYVFSGINPSKEVLNALLEAKKGWKEDLDVTIIPTYETDTLGYWMAQNQDDLAEYSIEVAPSASRCTVNLQDHETSCAAYRLEF